MADPVKRSGSLFEHLFLQFGAGSSLFRPLLRWRYLNQASWAVIVIGIVGWAFFIWFLHVHFPDF